MTVSWIVAGASTSAPKALEAARMHQPGSVTITTNGGLFLFAPGTLNHYLLFDMVACKRYSELSKAHQSRGTNLVTLDRPAHSLTKRGLDHFDEFLCLQRRDRHFIRGGYADIGFSGLYCTMYAVNNGATEVHWVGMEGYRSTPGHTVNDHFHGQLGPAKGVRQTRDILGPFMQSVADACPDIAFHFHGTPLFDLAGPNVTIQENLPCASAC